MTFLSGNKEGRSMPANQIYPFEPPFFQPTLTLFLCGDVMTGRGIDQVLPHSVDPRIYEPYVKTAKEYVLIAEQTNGPIPRKATYSYIWGDALDVWRQIVPDLKIINIETSITNNREP